MYTAKDSGTGLPEGIALIQITERGWFLLKKDTLLSADIGLMPHAGELPEDWAERTLHPVLPYSGTSDLAVSLFLRPALKMKADLDYTLDLARKEQRNSEA